MTAVSQLKNLKNRHMTLFKAKRVKTWQDAMYLAHMRSARGEKQVVRWMPVILKGGRRVGPWVVRPYDCLGEKRQRAYFYAKSLGCSRREAAEFSMARAGSF